MSVELQKFLKQYDTTGMKDEDGKSMFTHTALQPLKAYTIPMDKRKEFHRLLAQSVIEKKPVYITEKPPDVCCLRIDIDLKYPMTYSTRQHNDSHIKELLKLYGNAISTYIDLPDNKPIDAYVFQRKNPYPSKGNMKDGIHILYPDICCNVDIQYAIRTEVLKKIDLFLKNPDIGVLDIKNSNDDVIDLSIISRTNWMMYGSRKPSTKPYVLYKVMRLERSPINQDGEPGAFKDFKELAQDQDLHHNEDKLADLIDRFSIQNVSDERVYDIREEVRDIVEALMEKKCKRKQRSGYKTNNIKKKMSKLINDDEQKILLDEASKLVKLLADWRAEDFTSWINVGLCLHNISPNLLDSWTEFSKRSDSWQESDTDRWYGFTETSSGLNIGSLHRWARLDNPKKYAEVRREFLSRIMKSSITGVSQDVAQVIHKMYEHQYICLDPKGKRWAEFVNHGWKITDDGMSLKKRLGKEVLNEYLFLINSVNMSAAQDDTEQKDHLLHLSKSLADVSYKLRDISFKEKVMKECVIMFHDAKFEEQLDSNPMLVGLENGVYDLKEGVFRDGQPEDRISMSTGNDFPEYEDGDIDVNSEISKISEVQEIFDFMKQVLPKTLTRRYMWKFLASCLEGFNNDEKFHIFTGSGGNGKSKLIELLEMAYGQYCFKMPITFITSKRSQTGQATPELMLGKKARFGSMQEPDEGAKINTGLMKELSGNDKMFLRGLYASGEQFKPQFSLALLCNNKPKTTSEDEGTWRRMIVIDFISKFIEGNPKGPYEFKRDTNLVNNFQYWAPWFFVLMTEYYKIYKIEGLKAPNEIRDATKEYRKDSDSYARFVDECFVRDPTDIVKIEHAFEVFKSWYETEFSERPPPRRTFKLQMERLLNEKYGTGNHAGWTGWTIRHPSMNEHKDSSDEPSDDVLDKQPTPTVKANKVTVSIKPRVEM